MSNSSTPKSVVDGSTRNHTSPSNTRRIPVTFKNRSGLTLFGVLHQPEPASPGLAVILLSPGVKMRVGPERLYVRLADFLASLGLPVLRFDCYGLGDSEGTLTETQLRDVYGNIEVGRFVNDTIDAMDWMQRRGGPSRFILSGLCGGAITGLLAGARDARVAGLLALGITPLLASRSADPVRYMTAGQLDMVGRTYLEKVLRPEAWLRFLSFRTDYRLLWRSVSQSLFKSKRPSPAPPANVVPADDNASPLFPSAFFEMTTTGRPMLLVFGGSDRLGWEFDEKFVKRHQARLAAVADRYQVHTIPHANHVLSFGEWQDEMVEVSADWLRQHFAADLLADCATSPVGMAGGAEDPRS